MSLQPGTELDAKVAEVVFGRLVTWNREFMYLTEEEKKDDMRTFVTIPEYSTTWDGMQLVVEEMQRRGCGEVNIKKYEGMGGWRWAARFGKQGFEVAETLPHAVCIAALSALEGQADE